ncbi:MAG: hypothetical protein IT232_03260 [Flavobacteriales bacterium]|nr:hypothetical protein [Flavobacteriales bacterium]
MNFISQKNTFTIRGKTVISHAKRCKFNLTCDEYALLDAFYDIMVNENLSEIDTVYLYKKVYSQIGLSIEEYKSIGKSLVAKGMLIRTLTTGCYIINGKWSGESRQNIGDLFDKLWNLYGKVGNKAKAKIMFQRALKESDYEHLEKRIGLYKEFLKTSGQIQMHFSSFLNPEFKQYDNDFTIKLTHKANETKANINFLDEDRRVNR